MSDGKKKIDDWSNAQDTDLIVYFGEINRPYDAQIIETCRSRTLRKNVVLFLNTFGGRPDPAYRIARCLQIAYKTKIIQPVGLDTCDQNKYGTFTVFVDGVCKSAGTLICLGADSLIMSGNAELGPIDSQLPKKDEVGERESGLTPLQALQALEQQSLALFMRHFTALRFQEEITFSTKKAAQIATQITTGLLSPIYAQIDPIRLAETLRAMNIARDYGNRLQTDNTKKNTLARLLAYYPSHGFVIDRTEARELFKHVTPPTKELREIADAIKTTTLKEKWTFLSTEPNTDKP